MSWERDWAEHQYSDQRCGHQPDKPADDVLSATARNWERVRYYSNEGRDLQTADSALTGAGKWLMKLLPQARQQLDEIEAYLMVVHSHAHNCPDCGEYWGCIAACDGMPAAVCADCRAGKGSA